ncbi:hypothetical protein NOGI109294_19235 [Nocardiopsis gilva]|uniref:hypothetical protein n=1 Tax=Nocardiopsis gilva TaxID=280236 RepID=UPI000347480F|nr:hypothetical protein [Nocardiopsis gilva]
MSQSVRLGPAPSGIDLAVERDPENEERIVAYRLDQLRSAMEANLGGIQELAEGTGS